MSSGTSEYNDKRSRYNQETARKLRNAAHELKKFSAYQLSEFSGVDIRDTQDWCDDQCYLELLVYIVNHYEKNLNPIRI
jgi:hypothetical protein